MQFSPAWAYSHTYYTSALNMNCPEPLIIKLLVQQIHRVLLWQLKGDTDIEHMHLVGKMHLVGGGGQMCLNCTVLKTALCRCSCLSSALRYLLANENQSEVSFHYAQWHNPHLCNSLLKKASFWCFPGVDEPAIQHGRAFTHWQLHPSCSRQISCL